jgi:Cu-Zn family superoxide dismutase
MNIISTLGVGLMASLLGAGFALAEPLRAELFTTATPSVSVGVVEIGADGEVTAHLHGVAPGPHGLHLHQNGSCATAPGKDGAPTPGLAAGPHLDPAATARHAGPSGDGHLGDLPRVEAGADGVAVLDARAPRLAGVADLKGRAVVLHAGGDNYTDTPPLGGGGARFACGVLQ